MEPAMHTEPENQPIWIVVESTPDREEVLLDSLVLSAARIPHAVRAVDGQWQLRVFRKMAPRAREELALFAEENRYWPPAPPQAAEEQIVEKAPVVLPVVAALAVFHAVTGEWGRENPWFVAGAVNRVAVLDGGEWWRLITALTLHADVAHLLGNVFFGGILAHVLCRHLGNGLAWFSILLASVAANGINVLLHDNLYRSVGFSTAVFSMVGMLSGLRLRRVGNWREMVLALGSAAALLALLGSSGENTDLGAHFWGVGSGFFVGLVLAHGSQVKGGAFPVLGQGLLLALGGGTILVAWWLALAGSALS